MTRRTPLAWKNLTHDPRRLAVAAGGVGFAVLLIFMQLGFLNALLESTVQILRVVDGELVVISSAKYTLPSRERFDMKRLTQARSVAGISRIAPLYMETMQAVVRQPGKRGYPIRVFAFRDGDEILSLPSVTAQLSAMRQPHAALADSASRRKYGFFDNHRLEDYQGELAGKRIHLVGDFRLGVDFATDGNLLMTAANFARFFPGRAAGGDPLEQVDLAIVKLQPGVDENRVQRQLEQLLPLDVQVWNKQALIEREKEFWRTNAPVGYIFLVGVYVGFLVGVIICYQILFADITDHLAEFATLKAMGYPNRYFFWLVLSQASFLSMLGFSPGVVVSWVCYYYLAHITGLTMPLTWNMAALVFGVTWLMCSLSGLLALRKLAALDPADLF